MRGIEFLARFDVFSQSARAPNLPLFTFAPALLRRVACLSCSVEHL